MSCNTRLARMAFRCAAALMALFLCACSGPETLPRITTFTTVKGSADTALPKRFILSADSSAPEYLITAAERFCQRANLISDGIFSIAFVKSDNPVANFRNASADMILTDGDSAEALHSFFAVFNEPFRYGSYENFSMTCNAPPVLERLSEAASVHAFGAYYTGSYAFSGQKSLDEFLKLSRDIEFAAAEDEPENIKVSQELKVLTSPVLGAWIAEAFPYVTVADMAETFGSAAVLADADTLAETPFDDGLRRVNRADDADAWVVTRSFHRIKPVWLLLKPALYEELSPLGRAALSESAAFMTGDIDRVCLAREKAVVDVLEDEGAEISGEFTSTRSAILRGEAERNYNVPSREKEFRKLLSEYR